MSSGSYSIVEAEDGMGIALVLESSWENSLVDVIRRENVSVLRLSRSAGWDGKDISFLETLKGYGLRGIEVYAWDLRDITPLKFFPDLECLCIQCNFSKAPDFSLFGKLKVCKLFWRPKAESVFSCSSIELLNIVNYPTEDLKSISSMFGLRRLLVTSRKLRSLVGIESLKELRSLDLAGCTKLESLSGIEECRDIQSVELEGCRKVNDLSGLAVLTGLRTLVITDCGKIKSIKPLDKCQKLEVFIFAGDTNIEDGDLSSLLGIPALKKVWFSDRPHYTHRRDQITLMLS